MELSYPDFPTAYADMLFKFKVYAGEEETRNGKALVMPEPLLLHITNPLRRVIADANRNANPFFHVMETVWMFAGKWDPRWLFRFNKRMEEFSDEGPAGSMVINGAYGYRWFRHWGDQVSRVVNLLRRDPTSRQAVIAMWDPHLDLDTKFKDRPCNTHIYFRAREEHLEMTICNRSNDFIWGMMGANCVHLTYLHELIARALGLKVGMYSVMTNNLHFYLGVYPNEKDIWKSTDIVDSVYPRNTFPILSSGEDYGKVLSDCRLFVDGLFSQLRTEWLRHVAHPMWDVYVNREHGRADDIAADDWREASKRWLQRNR